MNNELRDFDAFPNAPGLASDLGLQRREDGKVPPEYDGRGYRWYSICSRHQEADEACELCAIGAYAPNPRRRKSKALSPIEEIVSGDDCEETR